MDARGKAYIESYEFTAADLWGADRGPRPAHIKQNGLGTCYILAAAGAVADRTPQVIRDRISYDPSSREFAVELFDRGSWKTIAVSQEELKSNMLHRGGSNFDDRVSLRGAASGGAIWPALYEVASGKMKWGSWENALEFETRPNGDMSRRIDGGQPGEMLTAITGRPNVRVPASELYEMTDAQMVKMVEARFASGQRITFNTNPQSLLDFALPVGRGGDSLAGSHAYTLLGARLDENGEAVLRIRNPQGRNDRSDLWGRSTPEAEMDVKWSELKHWFGKVQSVHSLDVAALSPANRALHDAIQSALPKGMDSSVGLVATAAARGADIGTAQALGRVDVTDDGRVWIRGSIPGFRTMVDANSDDASGARSVAQLARLDDPAIAEPARAASQRMV